MVFVIIVIVIGFIIWAVLGVKKDGDISKRGIVTDAVVSRVDVAESVNDNKKVQITER